MNFECKFSKYVLFYGFLILFSFICGITDILINIINVLFQRPPFPRAGVAGIKSTILRTMVEYFVIGILFMITPIASYNGSCGPAFKNKCSCGITEYDQLPQYVVNCTNEGFSDTSVLEHMPAEVTALIFTGNVLVTLPWNIFGKINEYPNLRVIDMSNNHIREIRGKPNIWFGTIIDFHSYYILN